MPPEIIALILLIVVLMVGAFFAGKSVERDQSEARQQAWREKNRRRWERKPSGGDILGGPWPLPEACFGDAETIRSR